MVEQNEWVFFKDIDWDDPNNNRFNIDTRDFHCGYHFSDEVHPDILTISKYPAFFFTKEEMLKQIERLYTESGGEGEWRMIDLESDDIRVRNWRLKYLRIFRTDKGFIICNSDYKALNKNLLSCDIDKKYLNYH
jgi:hypothetical protein